MVLIVQENDQIQDLKESENRLNLAISDCSSQPGSCKYELV